MCTHCITFNFTQRQESAPDRDTLQSFGQVLCQPKKIEPLPSNQLLGTSGRASGASLLPLLIICEAIKHHDNHGAADSSANGLEQWVDNGRREIREVTDSVVDEVHAKPNQETHDRANLKAIQDRRVASLALDRKCDQCS